MKKIQKTLVIFFLFIASMSIAQPQLTFQFANPRTYKVSGSDYFEFDLQVKSSSDAYIWSGTSRFTIDNATFSTVPTDWIAVRGELLAGDNTQANPKYTILKSTTGTPKALVIGWTGDFNVNANPPNSDDFNLVTTTFKTLLTIRGKIASGSGLAGISMVPSAMNPPNQKYHSAANTNTNFLNPNLYFEADLMNAYVGRIFSEKWDWSQIGNTVNGQFVDWAAEVNTSVWDGFPTLATGDFLANALRIHDGAILTIASDAGLKATGNTNISGSNSLVIKSVGTGLGSSGYFINNGTIAYENGGSVQVDRYLSETIYHYVSSPVSNATNAVLQGVNGTDDFWQWSEKDNQWENLNLGLPADELTVAKGYAVAYKNSAKTVSFIGSLNTGDILCAVTYTPTWLQKGFNFIGNPYPSPISANAFITENSTFFDETGGGLYFWDEAAGYNGVRWDYSTYTKAGGTSARPEIAGGEVLNGYIAPSQGFMVNINKPSTTIDPFVFNNNMRFTNGAYFFKEDEIITRSWLGVTGPEGDFNEVLTGFLAEGQFGIDITDAIKMKGNTNLAFYTLLDGKDYVIQGLPTFDPSKSYAFPLGLDAGIAGAYNFNLRETENFDPQVRFILEDKLTGVFFDLNSRAQYVAQVAATGEIKDRFVLHINGVTAVPEIDQKLAKVYAANNQIFISLTGNNKILDVEVFNTLGQTVLRTPVNATETTLNLQGSNVVYIVKVTTSQGVESHKVLLR